MLELLTNTRPVTSPTSNSSVRPPALSRNARARSVDRPRSRAKWFSVPSGSTPSAMPVPASTEATALMVTSPPPRTISAGAARGGPVAAAGHDRRGRGARLALGELVERRALRGAQDARLQARVAEQRL